MSASTSSSFVKRFGRGVTVGLVGLLAVAIAGSWMLAVYLLNGRGILNENRLDIQSGRAGQMTTLNSILTRSASLSPHVELMAVYATPEYLSVVRRQNKSIAYNPTTSFIFLINEDTHMDDLPLAPTPVKLRVNGTSEVLPQQLEMVTYSSHHKVTIATFSKVNELGQPVLGNEKSGVLELLAPTMDHTGMAYHEAAEVAMRWDLPIVYPEGALTAQQLPFGTMLTVSLGLLATVLTPCLLQLLLFYLSMLTGVSAEQMGTAALEPVVRRRVFTVAVGFVVGYTIVFTSAGALAGFAGETLQNAWSSWARPLAIGSGIVIIIMGLWMALRAQAPLICRLPIARTRFTPEKMAQGGLFRSTLMGLSFAVGCSTCFGGALIATLLLYVGTLGSTWEGALILFFFSLGVGIPFLLAAALLTRVLPLVQRIQPVTRAVGLVSSVIMMAFGILLITNKFHLVSAWMAPILGLD